MDLKSFLIWRFVIFTKCVGIESERDRNELQIWRDRKRERGQLGGEEVGFAVRCHTVKGSKHFRLGQNNAMTIWSPAGDFYG